MLETDPIEARRLLAHHLEELQAAGALPMGDPGVYTRAEEARLCVRGVFGVTSKEYDRIKDLVFVPQPFPFAIDPPIEQRGARAQMAFEARRTQANNIKWSNAVREARILWTKLFDDYLARVDERIDPSATPPGVTKDEANDRFAAFDLHPLVRDVAWPQFKDGHYAPAVFEAAKALNNRIKYGRVVDSSGTPLIDDDGSGLMFRVFGGDNPLLVVADRSTDTGQSLQEGASHLFAGAMLAIRNPRAHDNVVDTPQDALERLAFLSMLARIVEEATFVPF